MVQDQANQVEPMQKDMNTQINRKKKIARQVGEEMNNSKLKEKWRRNT